MASRQSATRTHSTDVRGTNFAQSPRYQISSIAHVFQEPQGEPEEPSAGESPAKRTGFKLPRIRPLNLRRLSLPTRDRSPALQPPSAGYVQRRNTDGEAPVRADESENDTPPVVAPLSPRKLFRGAAGVFISARRKVRHNGRRKTGGAHTELRPCVALQSLCTSEYRVG